MLRTLLSQFEALCVGTGRKREREGVREGEGGRKGEREGVREGGGGRGREKGKKDEEGGGRRGEWRR